MIPIMVTYAILLGGRLTPGTRLRRQIQGARFIAADSGMKHAAALDVPVDLWIGDFDSSDSDLRERNPKVKKCVHSRDKNNTDGALALREAIRCGARRILMIGGLGGDSDHSVSHLVQMIALSKAGISTMVTSGREEAHPLIPGSTHLDTPPGTRLSVIGFSELKGLSLSHTRWPLTRQNLPLGSTLAMSNEALGNVTIHIENGDGVAILTIHDDLVP